MAPPGCGRCSVGSALPPRIRVRRAGGTGLLAFRAMTPLLILLAAIVIGVLLGLLVTIPSIRKKEDAAIKVTKDALGASEVVMIEPRTTAMGFEPTSANGVKAMCCLTASATDLMAVSWSNRTEWRIARSAITKVDTEAPDPASVQKASILITYTTPEGDEVLARFRLKEPVPWLTELGYDWGPEGPPVLEDDDADD